MKKIAIHPLPVRIWHWVNALGFVLLILTGLQIRYRDVLGLASFEGAVRLHNAVGFTLIADYFIWLLFYLTSDRIRNYRADLAARSVLLASVKQAAYYGWGIFFGLPNPHHASPYEKFNPMQKMLYQIIMLLAVPLQFASGLLLWDVQRFSGAVALLGGVRWVDTLHVLLFIFFTFFLPVHVYLATLGPTPTAHLKAMFTGYEEEDEGQVGAPSAHRSAEVPR
jgi:Ni/Fe-hydrogenase b-type cytochrome subunit